MHPRGGLSDCIHRRRAHLREWLCEVGGVEAIEHAFGMVEQYI